MAPEMFSGKAEARSDVYALGLTLYELLTLRPAFDAPERTLLLASIESAMPVPLRKVNPAIPFDLETVIGKAMAKMPTDRYSAHSFWSESKPRFRIRYQTPKRNLT